MSATVPDTAAETPADGALAVRRRWPRVSFGLGGSVFEWRGATLFMRMVGAEIYVYTAEVSDWWTLREDGCFEAAMGRLRLSAAKATGPHEP